MATRQIIIIIIIDDSAHWIHLNRLDIMCAAMASFRFRRSTFA
jgi:hypothetical protein